MTIRFDSAAFSARVAGRMVVKKRLKKNPRMVFPIGAEREYQRDLLKVVSNLKALTNSRFIPRLSFIYDRVNARRANPIRQDAISDDMDDVRRILSDIRIEYEGSYTEDQLYDIAMRRGFDVSRFNKDQFNKIFKTVLGVDPTIAEPWLIEQLEVWATSNVSLITSIKTRYFQEIESSVIQGLMTGVRWEEIAQDIQDRYSVSESRADLIARDQIGKLSSNLNEFRQTKLGVTQYIWRTSNDERVRDSHKEKEGKTFSWDDPPADTGNPGEDYQCRCYADPVFESIEQEKFGEE